MPKAMQFSKGSLVYFEGDKDERIFILQKGSMVVYTIDIETGAEVNEPIKQGEFFGVKSALGHFPREESVRVLEPSIAIAMTIQEFENLFSNNRELILKMLKVFSGQLRNIHHKISSILKDEEDSIDKELLGVINSFYQDSQLVTTIDLCTRYLKKFPNLSNKNAIARILSDSMKKHEIEVKRGQVKTLANNGHGEEVRIVTDNDFPMSHFALPAFSRFAKKFSPGQVLIAEFEPGDCFYLIQSGHVQLLKTINGVNKNLDVLGPSQFLGEMAILDNSARSATCVALDDVEVLEFNKTNFALLIAGQPQIALLLLKMFCKRIYDQKRRLRILTISDITARVGDVFLMLEETQTKNCIVQGDDIQFNLTVSNVANWAGLPLHIVTDELNRLAKNNRIVIYDNYIVVKNMVELKRIVEHRRTLGTSNLL